MKKALPLLLVCLMISLISSAQINKGAHLIGGSIGFSTLTTNSDRGSFNGDYNNFRISPAYGYAIKKNLIIGGDVEIQTGKNETLTSTQKFNGFGAGFFVRRYLPLGKGFYLFGQGRFGVLQTKDVTTTKVAPTIESTRTQTSAGVSVYPGVSYAINNKLQLEIGLNNLFSAQFSSGKNESSNSSEIVKTSNFDLRTNLTSSSGLYVGLQILINN